MPYLKVIALPHPKKVAKDRQKAIITNQYVITSLEQSIGIAIPNFAGLQLRILKLLAVFDGTFLQFYSQSIVPAYSYHSTN